MFNIGDKVKCVRGYDNLIEGNIYTITEHSKMYDTHHVAETDGAWSADRFVLAEKDIDYSSITKSCI